MRQDTKSASGMIKLTASDGHVLSAWLATPNGPAKGAVIICQDAYGVGDYIRSVCDYYAALGYKTIAPLFYDRQKRDALFDHSAEGRKAAGALRKGLSWDQVAIDAAAAYGAIADAGKVGILGFCVGGSMAWHCARSMPVQAASCYYGKDIIDWLDDPPSCPTEMHFGEKDHLIPIADVLTMKRACSHMDFYTYDAGHGFDGVGKGFSEDASRLARQRTAAFFARHLS